jgi:hypothetical protein
MLMMMMLMAVFVFMSMAVKLNSARAFVGVLSVSVTMLVIMIMSVIVFMIMREVNVKLYPGDGGFLLLGNMQVITLDFKFFQLAFEPAGVHSQVQQRSNEHVPRNAADEVEIESLHLILFGD